MYCFFQLRSNIEIMKKTLNKDIDLRETFGNRMEKLDISLEGVESVLEVLTKRISEIHQKLETLEDESAMQKLQGNTLISRQNTLEQRENFLEEQLQKLQMASCSLDSKGAADFKEGLTLHFYLIYFFLKMFCISPDLR